MDSKAQEVDQKREDNKAQDTGTQMSGEFSHRHLGVAKLPPEVLNRVEPDKRGDEQADQLHACNESNAEPSHHQPQKPLKFERSLALRMELGPAESSSDGAEEKHGVEQDKAADRSIRVLA